MPTNTYATAQELLEGLQMTAALKSRINIFTPHTTSSSSSSKYNSTSSVSRVTQPEKSTERFVLYLPTVNLRKEHNPAFALTCLIANHLNVPCLVLAVVLDDHSMPLKSRATSIEHESISASAVTSSKDSPLTRQVVMTSRRLAFILEALSESTKQWSDHGAGVAIRVHGPKCRSPDYLTLSSKAMAVVTDEPFVNPFLSFVQRVERSCKMNLVPCFRVDGSTTVPPRLVLKRNSPVNGREGDDMIYYTGVPAKAWMWQRKTESQRMKQVKAAMDGEFDAPPLKEVLENIEFFMDENALRKDDGEGSCMGNDVEVVENGDENMNTVEISSKVFPLPWRESSRAAPGCRPWTVSELQRLLESNKIKSWALNWHGADSSVRPCSQTVGTSKKGMQRWNDFIRDRKGLVYYAKRRTDPVQPHASSRMSCYLNFGIVSIFRLVHEVKLAQAAKVSGASKFEEEIVKWREMSYAHAFSRGDYDGIGSVPDWAVRWLSGNSTLMNYSANNDFDVTSLQKGTTGDDKWDAMQRYLINTGELHNNCRMTWGKQIVHWGVTAHCTGSDATEKILQMLCYLNDRFALDGLSPPSYAGLLWCIGWCDKPGSRGGISKKPASRYKIGPDQFKRAEEVLLEDRKVERNSGRLHHQTSIITGLQTQGRKRNGTQTDIAVAHQPKSKKTLDHFFGKRK